MRSNKRHFIPGRVLAAAWRRVAALCSVKQYSLALSSHVSPRHIHRIIHPSSCYTVKLPRPGHLQFIPISLYITRRLDFQPLWHLQQSCQSTDAKMNIHLLTTVLATVLLMLAMAEAVVVETARLTDSSGKPPSWATSISYLLQYQKRTIIFLFRRLTRY